MPFKSEKQRKWMWANDPKMAQKWEDEEKVRETIRNLLKQELSELDEEKKRDYKAEYKKYGSSKKAKKYRAELNAYNRKKGTYGNGDKKDASHKGGKIVGFEAESKNRGRREKSRLKKEIKELIDDVLINEIEWKKVIRKGKKVRKAVCPDNRKYVPAKKKCVAIKGSEKQKMKKAAIKNAKKRKLKMGKIMKKRAKSMKKRAAQIGKK